MATESKKHTMTTYYSLREVQEHMEQYLDASERRLRARLKEAWKQRASFKIAYGREKASVLRAGAR